MLVWQARLQAGAGCTHPPVPPCSPPPAQCTVLVGSGHRLLGALIVPNAEALEELAQERGERACAAAAPGRWTGLLSMRQSACACLPCAAHRSPAPAELLSLAICLADPPYRLRSALPRPAGLVALPPAEVDALVGGEVRARLAGRVRWEHVAAYEVLSQPFRWVSVDST